MCTPEHSECFCKRICGMLRLIMTGVVIGTVAGMIGMYFFDHDKCMKSGAKKILQSAEEFTHNMKSKIDEE